MADVEKVEAGKELEYLNRNVLDVENETEDKNEVTDDDKATEDGSSDVDGETDTEVESTEEAEDEADKDVEEDEDDDTEETNELDDTSVIDKVKKLSPELLKKVPELRAILYKEQEYSKSFSSPEEAKEAREAIDSYQTFEADIVSGESANLIETLEKTSKDGLKKFLGNFIPTVFEHNKDLALQMLYPEFKKMLRAARGTKNENISKSAENIHYFIFGDSEFNKEEGLQPKQKSDGESDLERREREFAERKANTFYNDVKTTVEKRLTRIIEKSLENTGLSTLAREAAINKIASRVDDAVRKDKRFQGNLKELGAKARRSDFSIEGKDSIISAYLSRAKMQISKVRQEVLKEADIKTTSNKTKTNPVRLNGSQVKQTLGKVDVKNIDWGKKSPEYPSGYSEENYLNGVPPPLKKSR